MHSEQRRENINEDKRNNTASVFKMILRVTHHKTINISNNEFWFKGK